jgi:hypothetical protein
MPSSGVPIYSRRMRSQEDRDEQTVLIASVVIIAAIAFALIFLAVAAINWLF